MIEKINEYVIMLILDEYPTKKCSKCNGTGHIEDYVFDNDLISYWIGYKCEDCKCTNIREFSSREFNEISSRLSNKDRIMKRNNDERKIIKENEKYYYKTICINNKLISPLKTFCTGCQINRELINFKYLCIDNTYEFLFRCKLCGSTEIGKVPEEIFQDYI